jgi:hypothetical protein
MAKTYTISYFCKSEIFFRNRLDGVLRTPPVGQITWSRPDRRCARFDKNPDDALETPNADWKTLDCLTVNKTASANRAFFF